MMTIDIQSRPFSLTESLRDYSDRRIRSALTRFEGRVQRISMWLSDINGPRGGKDKHCRLQVVLAGGADVVVDETQADMHVAINRAVERAGRSMARKLDRKPSRNHSTRTDVFESSPSS